jgi:hypothetical protein
MGTPIALEPLIAKMKPHIWRQDGVWYCKTWRMMPMEIRGVGVTPVGAYVAWRKSLERHVKDVQKRAQRERPMWDRFIRKAQPGVTQTPQA